MQERFELDDEYQRQAELCEMPSPIELPEHDVGEIKGNLEGILRFNREDTYGNDAFMRAVKADMAYRALWDITQKLRSYRKYYEFKSEEISEFFDTLDDELMDIINDSDINLDSEYS